MNQRNFFSELKRRNVHKVAVAYIVGGWALAQGIAQVFPVFDVSNWAIRLLVLLIILGFPVAVAIAWFFELTPEGIKRTAVADAMPKVAGHKKRAWIYVVIVGAVVSIGLFSLGRYTAQTKPSESSDLTNRSVAVLPFENLSKDPENAYFSEGIQDEILTRLAKIAQLKVISRASTDRFKSAPGDISKIAQQLGVTHILEGSVQRANDKVRVNVQLIDARNDAHLWAESYDRQLTDIFAVESEIAKTVADVLKAKLTGAADQVLASRPTDDPEAHDLYFKGRYFWDRRTAENIEKAKGFFKNAIDKDPSYAVAWAGLADVYSLGPIYTDTPPREDIQRALAAAHKALDLDEFLAEAHTSLANALVDDLQFAAADKEFKRAIELNPNYATAHQWYGESLQAQARFEEAFSEVKKAFELNPLSPIINAVYGACLNTTGHPDEAIVQFRKTLELERDFAPGLFMQAQVYEDKGDLKQALALYEKAASLSQTAIREAMVARINAQMGKTGKARQILNELLERRQHQFVQSYPIALIYLALGEKEPALKFLEAAYDERGIQVGGNTGSLVADKRLDPLRGDPRFEALVAKFLGHPR
ncbi:MAG TPA: tetratricopeptide repeat protein [Chthoniobacterales bacterium]|jgi:TolB-like protein/Tfp pilus assembly protein PilF